VANKKSKDVLPVHRGQNWNRPSIVVFSVILVALVFVAIIVVPIFQKVHLILLPWWVWVGTPLAIFAMALRIGHKRNSDAGWHPRPKRWHFVVLVALALLVGIPTYNLNHKAKKAAPSAPKTVTITVCKIQDPNVIISDIGVSYTLADSVEIDDVGGPPHTAAFIESNTSTRHRYKIRYLGSAPPLVVVGIAADPPHNAAQGSCPQG